MSLGIQSDEEVGRLIRQSQHAVFAVAKWMNFLGAHVTIGALHVREHRDDRARYADSGDLYAKACDPGDPIPSLDEMHLHEVKQRLDDVGRFTSLESFPYSTVFVDTTYSYDWKARIPYAYWTVNAAMNGAIWIPGDRSRWTIRTITDKRKGTERTVYECPLIECKFYDLRVDG